MPEVTSNPNGGKRARKDRCVARRAFGRQVAAGLTVIGTPL